MRTTTLIKVSVTTLLFVVMTSITPPPALSAPIWGRLANPGFVNQRIKATLFFAGQALDGTNKYNCNPPPGCNAPNCPSPQYTMIPLDDSNLKWSESADNRNTALKQMVRDGINVINMSSWGEDFLPCAWVTGAAPMQTAPGAQDELFTAAVGKPLLIVPFLESRDGQYPWHFRDEFPQNSQGQTAPLTVSQIVNLINRYLKNPNHPEWAQKWARMYDQTGAERYAIAVIHASSNNLNSGDDAQFAAGFDAIATAVSMQTQINVGFFIDALPPGTNAPGNFKPSSKYTGPELRKSQSLLGIECFVPEVWTGSSDTPTVINWKRDFSSGWFQTGIPFVMDVSPGYDNHLVFPNTAIHYGMTTDWLCQLAQMINDYGQAGMVFNAWNGYTEGIAAVPIQNYNNLFYDWLRSLQYADVYAQKPDAPLPRNGTWACPYTLDEAIQHVPVGRTIGLLPTTTTPFDAPITLTKNCTIISLGGNAKIGP